MVTADRKSATLILLLALSGNGFCFSDAGNENTKVAAEPITGSFAMFPDGLRHDFGTVPRGPEVRHAFRIRNTTGAALEIVSLRVG